MKIRAVVYPLIQMVWWIIIIYPLPAAQPIDIAFFGS